MGADEPLVCSPPSTAARVSAAHFGPFTAVVQVLPAYPTRSLSAVLV